jgi:hypothetical protein
MTCFVEAPLELLLDPLLKHHHHELSTPSSDGANSRQTGHDLPPQNCNVLRWNRQAYVGVNDGSNDCSLPGCIGARPRDAWLPSTFELYFGYGVTVIVSNAVQCHA